MTNFEKIKNSKDEYEITDLIFNYISTHNLLKEECELDSLSFLNWLKEEVVL